jgi:hypothetical protein
VNPLEGAGGGGSEVAATFGEELVGGEAVVAFPAVGVEDPELGPSAGRPEPVAGHGHLGSLADDVAPEADPGAASQLEAKACRFADGRREPAGQSRRLERDEERLCPASQRGKAPQPIGNLGEGRAGIRMGWQVDDEEVDRAGGEERPGNREALVEGRRGHDDEPIESYAAGDGLDRIERPGHVEPRDDRALRLGLGGKAKGKRGLSGARLATERDAGAPGQAAGPENRVERGEAGSDDPLVGLRGGSGECLGRLVRQWHGRERTDDPRSCRSPACLEGRQSSRHVRGERRHGQTIEQMF